MTRTTFARRRILQGLGGSLMALPFLRSMPSRAEGMTAPKRLVVFFTGNEPINRKAWSPGNPGPLTSLPPMMAALEPLRQKLTMIGGLKLEAQQTDPHTGAHTGAGHLLTGHYNVEYGPSENDYYQGAVSLDQYLGKRQGLPPWTLGVRSQGAEFSSTGASKPVIPQQDPLSVFTKYFGGDGGGSEAEQAAKRARKQSVLDFVSKDLSAAKKGLPGEDAQKLESHLEAIREIEKSLGANDNLMCTATKPAKMNYLANENLPVAARLQMDLLAQGLACGMTNIGTIQIGGSGGGNTPDWPDEGMNIKMNEHDVAHAFNTAATPAIIKDRHAIEAYYFKLYAYMLQQLDNMIDTDGKTVLDNTLVLYTKPMGFGHNCTDMLFMIGGSGGGAMKTGRFVDFPKRSNNDLLTSICNMMGYPDVMAFGDPKFCDKPLEL